MHLERRLGPHGDYSSREFETQLARDRFFECLSTLETAKQMKATPIAELRRRVYPLFRELQSTAEAIAAVKLRDPLFGALVKWMKDFNLTVVHNRIRVPSDWVFRKALLTLYAWHKYGLTPKWAGGAIYSEFDFIALRSSLSEGAYSLSLVGRKPDPLTEKFREFRARVISQLEPLLRREWDAALASADASDLVKWHAKRQDEHFRWLCLYQVEGLTYEQVAERCQEAKGIDTATARRGIEAAASLVGLDLRPPRRGPARKKSGVSA
jgi:hypothetical protein